MGLPYGVGAQPVAYAMPATPPQQTNAQPPRMGDSIVVDGTPVRVVVLCLAAAAGLTALRFGGFRFNVGVSS